MVRMWIPFLIGAILGIFATVIVACIAIEEGWDEEDPDDNTRRTKR